MTGGFTANYTYKEVEGRFECTLEFGEQVLTSLAPTKRMVKQMVAARYLEANPSPDRTPLAAEDNFDEAGVRRDGEHLLPDPWRGSTNPAMVREIQ